MVVQFCLVQSANTNTAILPSIFDSIHRSIAQGWPWWHILIYFLRVPPPHHLEHSRKLQGCIPVRHDRHPSPPGQRKLSALTLIAAKHIKKLRPACNLLCNDCGGSHRLVWSGLVWSGLVWSGLAWSHRHVTVADVAVPTYASPNFLTFC